MASRAVGLLNNEPAYIVRNAIVSKPSQLFVALLRRVESQGGRMCGPPKSDSAVWLGKLMTSLVAHRVGGGGDDGAAVDRLQSGHAETRPFVITLVNKNN